MSVMVTVVTLVKMQVQLAMSERARTPMTKKKNSKMVVTRSGDGLGNMKPPRRHMQQQMNLRMLVTETAMNTKKREPLEFVLIPPGQLLVIERNTTSITGPFAHGAGTVSEDAVLRDLTGRGRRKIRNSARIVCQPLAWTIAFVVPKTAVKMVRSFLRLRILFSHVRC